MNWFRFYHGALHDPKVQSLRPELFKFWVNLLCLIFTFMIPIFAIITLVARKTGAP